jgi:hypothetical protein
VEPVGPQTISLRELLEQYRLWMGFGHGHRINVPMPAMRLLARIGDLARLGPMTTTSLQQLIAGNAGDGLAFEEAIGFRPRSLQSALQARPAQVQDRWHARLYFLSPLIRVTLVFLWLASAALGFLNGKAATAQFISALHLQARGQIRCASAPACWTWLLQHSSFSIDRRDDPRGFKLL